MDEGGEIWFGSDGHSTPARKSFLSDVKSGVTPVTIWKHSEVGHNHKANNELKELLGQGVFNNPKPTRLLEKIIELSLGDATDKGIILDFFAGSGTTGHAVLARNASDCGRRRYILVQLPEQLDSAKADQKAAVGYLEMLRRPRNIAELTKERLRRAAAKIKTENPTFSGDLGFRVFKLDTSNIRAWEPDRDNLERSLLANVEHIKPDRSEDDILYELLLKLGLDLCVPIERRSIQGKSVYSIGAGTLIACLDVKIDGKDVESLANGITGWYADLAPAGDTTVLFRDSAFADDVAKTNLTAILEQHGLGNVRSL